MVQETAHDWLCIFFRGRSIYSYQTGEKKCRHANDGDYIWKKIGAFDNTHGKLFDSTDIAFSSEPRHLSRQSSCLPYLKPAFTQPLRRVEME